MMQCWYGPLASKHIRQSYILKKIVGGITNYMGGRPKIKVFDPKMILSPSVFYFLLLLVLAKLRVFFKRCRDFPPNSTIKTDGRLPAGTQPAPSQSPARSHPVVI